MMLVLLVMTDHDAGVTADVAGMTDVVMLVLLLLLLVMTDHDAGDDRS